MIMYVCERCAEDAPESCGHYDPGRLRVMPSGMWICAGCYDEFEFGDARDRDQERPAWASFPRPPEYIPVG
jgi:hypothetical protein